MLDPFTLPGFAGPDKVQVGLDGVELTDVKADGRVAVCLFRGAIPLQWVDSINDPIFVT
jgi:hypothetical protein